jgi:hypothetical protein
MGGVECGLLHVLVVPFMTGSVGPLNQHLKTNQEAITNKV